MFNSQTTEKHVVFHISFNHINDTTSNVKKLKGAKDKNVAGQKLEIVGGWKSLPTLSPPLPLPSKHHHENAHVLNGFNHTCKVEILEIKDGTKMEILRPF